MQGSVKAFLEQGPYFTWKPSFVTSRRQLSRTRGRMDLR